jgi:hypothetical protein
LLEVTNPMLENIEITYCDWYQDRNVVMAAVDKTFCYESENIVAGKLLEEKISIPLKGTSASGRVTRKITIPAITHSISTTVTGRKTYFERLWASLKIKHLMQQFQPLIDLSAFEDIPFVNAFENQNQILHDEVLEQATNYNLVTYLTPFIMTDKTTITEDEVFPAELYVLGDRSGKGSRLVIK